MKLEIHVLSNDLQNLGRVIHQTAVDLDRTLRTTRQRMLCPRQPGVLMPSPYCLPLKLLGHRLERLGHTFSSYCGYDLRELLTSGDLMVVRAGQNRVTLRYHGTILLFGQCGLRGRPADHDLECVL